MPSLPASTGRTTDKTIARGTIPGPAVDHNHHATREPIRHVTETGGIRAARDERGRLRDLDRPGMHLHHDLKGGRRAVIDYNGRRAVFLDRNHVYLERSYLRRPGRVYVQRTYFVGGRSYASVYRSYRYRGVVYYGYVPPLAYRPAFYGWAFTPWAAPVAYRWEWAGEPWLPAYGYYFAPYPAYAAPYEWLTDYLLAENLRLAYEQRADAETAAPQVQTALSPEVKTMIATEVQRQLAGDQAHAQHQADEAAPPAEEMPAALDAKQRLFIVASTLDLMSETGECAVTAGDVLLRTGNEDASGNVAVQVASAKQGDCKAGTSSQLQLSELQEMHNRFRETLDAGLKSLAERQDKDGLPAAPDITTSAGEVPQATPDPDAAAELQQQREKADRLEAQAAKANPGSQQ